MIRKRTSKSGFSYQAEVYVGGRRVATKSFARKRDAEKFELETKANYQASQAKVSLSFNDLITKYRELHLSKRSHNTQCRYDLEIDRRILPFFRGLRLEGLKPLIFEEFMSQVRKEIANPRSVNFTLEVLRAILNKAVAWEMLASNPMKVEFLAVPNKDYDWIETPEEIAAVMGFARNHSKYYEMALVALEAGLRIGEILGLRVSDFDFATGQILIERQWLNRSREYGPPKHKLIRRVPMSSAIREVFTECLGGMTRHAPVFTTDAGKIPGAQTVFDGFRRITGRSINRPMGPHAFRHTFGSWYMRVYDDMWELSRLMGHANVETTRRYSHHSAKQRQAALDLWDHGKITAKDSVTPKSSKESNQVQKCSERDLNTPSMLLAS